MCVCVCVCVCVQETIDLQSVRLMKDIERYESSFLNGNFILKASAFISRLRHSHLFGKMFAGVTDLFFRAAPVLPLSLPKPVCGKRSALLFGAD